MPDLQTFLFGGPFPQHAALLIINSSESLLNPVYGQDVMVSWCFVNTYNCSLCNCRDVECDAITHDVIVLTQITVTSL